MSWLTTKIVVRECYVSFDPVDSDAALPVDLSTPMREISSGEPIYAIITGRPAGIVNYLMQFVGLNRRFEFVISATQVCTRMSSTSSQIMSVSKLTGLNSVGVGLRRAVYQFLFFLILAILSFGMAGYSKGQIEQEYSNNNLYDGDMTNSLAARSTDLLSNNVWLFSILATFFLLVAFYKLFLDRLFVILMSEGGENVVNFVLSPSLIERGAISAEDVQKVGQLFRVLKNAPTGHIP